MALNTAGDLVAFALRASSINGIGQTPMAEDANDALDTLNMMLAQWQQRRWLVWSLTDTHIPSTGAQSYTIGAGGDFNVLRPAKIDSAFARMIPAGGGSPPQQIDYHLTICEAMEDYNLIGIKSLTTFPAALFYESSWPLGRLKFWPIPSTQFELHVTTKTDMQLPLALTDPINMPPEYMQGLVYTLACYLRPMYGMGPDPQLMGYSAAGLATIRAANTQIPVLHMPAGVVRGGRGGLAASSSPGFMSGGMAW